MNDIIRAMKERRSIRKFRPDMPSKEDIDSIIEAGLYAPSGMNRQSAIVIAVTDKKKRDELAKDNCRVVGWPDGTDPFYGAPVILICRRVHRGLRRIAHDGQYASRLPFSRTRQHLDPQGKRGVRDSEIQKPSQGAGHRRQMDRHRPLCRRIRRLRTSGSAEEEGRKSLSHLILYKEHRLFALRQILKITGEIHENRYSLLFS